MGLETNWMLMVMALMLAYAAAVIVGLIYRRGAARRSAARPAPPRHMP
jgi:hypothetical protein